MAEQPILTNDVGTKFWLDIGLTDYGRCSDLYGTRLNIHVLRVEPIGGDTFWMLADTEDNTILFETTRTFKMIEHIQALKELKRLAPKVCLVMILE